MTEREKTTFIKAIENYGIKHQLIVAVEELSELQKEICKMLRGIGDVNHLTEEMADAQIVMDQLQIFYGNADEVKRWRSAKVDKLNAVITLDEMKRTGDNIFCSL